MSKNKPNQIDPLQKMAKKKGASKPKVGTAGTDPKVAKAVKKRESKPEMPAVIVDSDLSHDELFPEVKTISILGQELEVKRNNFGLSLFQGVLERYFDNDAEGLSTLDTIYAISYAYTRSSRNKLKRKPGVDPKLAHKLARCGFEEWCDMVEDVEAVTAAVMTAFGEDDDSGNAG